MQLSYRGRNLKIDSKNIYLLSKYKFYWDHRTGYLYCRLGGKRKTLHRLLLNFPDGIVDHKNRDKTDNRLRNLRVVCKRSSNINRDIMVTNTTGYIGVFKISGRERWCAMIGFKEERKYLGYFSCKHEAARAYNKEAKKRYGKFAVLNTIQKGK
jgi:hypothetical protein